MLVSDTFQLKMHKIAFDGLALPGPAGGAYKPYSAPILLREGVKVKVVDLYSASS